MTQPSSVNKTFDTSLLDVQRSFSSTETNTSGSSGNSRPRDQIQQTTDVQSVLTSELYDQWANTYDTDGNALQAVDDIQIREMFPLFVRRVCEVPGAHSNGSQATRRVLDFGCGTGRNTLKLLQAPWTHDVTVEGWDGSQAMLEVAKRKCERHQRSSSHAALSKLRQMDFMDADGVPREYDHAFDGVISTLVLEHIPLETFFGTVWKVLRPGGLALVTNMHSAMGAISRAGYQTPSGGRVRGVSYIHTVKDTVDAAERAGFEIVPGTNVREVVMDQKMIDGGVVDGVVYEKGSVGERGRKWLGIAVWYGMLLRKA